MCSFFPSVFISDKINEQNELSVSVGRRIDRPTYKQLNPFKFYLDPSTYVEGNPFFETAADLHCRSGLYL